MGRMSRDKGKRGERELVEFLRDHGVDARRGVQYQGGPDSPDVVHDMRGVHVECKRTERFRIYEAIEQARAEKKDGDIPAVFHRMNGRPWVVVLDAADFLALARATRMYSPVYRSSSLKKCIIDSVLKKEISQQEAEEMIVEYGLRSV